MSLARNLVRFGSLALVVAMVFFLYAETPARAATTYSVNVGGETQSNVTSGVVWFNGYDPGTIVINVGDTILWTVKGGIHTVTSTQALPAGGFAYDSSPLITPAAVLSDLGPGLLLPPGSTYDVDTSGLAPGTYNYFCKIHPGMAGTLTITSALPVQEIVTAVAGFGDSVFAQQAFVPAALTVGQGTIVRWSLLNPTEPHTITAANGAWDSSPLLPEGAPPVLFPTDTFPWTFTSAGTFTYFCKLHAYQVGDSWVGMVGTVVVEPLSDAAAISNANNLAYIGIGLGGVALVLAVIAMIRRRP